MNFSRAIAWFLFLVCLEVWLSGGTDDSCVGLFPVLYCMNFIRHINVVRFSLSQEMDPLSSWTYTWRQNFCYFRSESLVYQSICKRIKCSITRKRRVYYATPQRKVLVKVKAFEEVKYCISRPTDGENDSDGQNHQGDSFPYLQYNLKRQMTNYWQSAFPWFVNQFSVFWMKGRRKYRP